MASGGDGYTMMAQKNQVSFGALDEALIEYLGGIGADGIESINNQPSRIQNV